MELGNVPKEPGEVQILVYRSSRSLLNDTVIQISISIIEVKICACLFSALYWTYGQASLLAFHVNYSMATHLDHHVPNDVSSM